MWKTIRRYYWLTQGFLARHFAVMLRTTLFVVIASTIFIFLSKYIPTARKVSRIGLVGKYTVETIPLTIQSKVSSGLVRMDAHGDPQPALADSWKVSDDGKVYTFQLNTNVKWHDGTNLKPEDIKYNFKEVATTYDDKGIVTFTLEEPFSPFYQAVSRPLLKDGTIGTGEFRIQKLHAVSGVLQQVTLISEQEKYIYKFYPTESSAITAFQLGEIDKLDNISYVPPDTKNDSTISVVPNNSDSRIAVLFFNNNDALLSSKSARQGLAYAIKDKNFGHSRALSPIDKNSWGYNPLVKDYEYDSTRANTLFFTDIKKDQNPHIELKTTLAYLDTAETIAQSWRDTLGVQVDVKVVTNIGTDYQALLTDYEPPADPDQYTIWHSTQSTNFTHYNNLKVDKLLEDGRRTTDKKLRIDIYQDFQRFLLEDCPAVFLFNTSGYTISRNSLFH